MDNYNQTTTGAAGTTDPNYAAADTTYDTTQTSGAGVAPHHHHAVRDAVGGAAIGAAGGELKHDWDRNHGRVEDRHLGRDAALGAAVAGGGAEADNMWRDHRAQAQTTGTATGEPTTGEKIKGTFKKMEGKLTGNEAKVIEGQQLKQGVADPSLNSRTY
ncbi:hypothetical protein BC937DRAFT_92876 [Endogone sp. FLAS-F59071]|nr:hypothetical protein BC937DRAFT_92876 [Endogone sp. FLAS-F59071]|eukprot:RUS15121.1 hypothetical protein BC937DRAFT_92876 [Endogone sp. FLAS-F59071]